MWRPIRHQQSLQPQDLLRHAQPQPRLAAQRRRSRIGQAALDHGRRHFGHIGRQAPAFGPQPLAHRRQLRRWRRQHAHPHQRRQALGEAGDEIDLLGRHGLVARSTLAGIKPINVVFDDHGAVLLRQRQQCSPPRRSGLKTQRVLAHRRRIDGLGTGLGQRLLQRRRHHALAVHRHRMHAHAQIGHGRQRARIGRCLGQDHRRLRPLLGKRQVQPLLRPVAQNDLVSH